MSNAVVKDYYYYNKFMIVACACFASFLYPKLEFSLLRRIENKGSSFYRVSGVSREGSVAGEEGYLGLHDGHTQPVWFKKGKKSRKAVTVPGCSLPVSKRISAADLLFQKFPSGGAADCTWPTEGRLYTLKPGVEICQLTYEAGMQEFSQVVIRYASGKSSQLHQEVPGLKGYATTNIVHIDAKGWMVVAGYQGSFYNLYNSVRTGSMGEQLFWISYR